MWEFEEGNVYAAFASLLFDSGRSKAGRECLRKAIELAKVDNEHDFQIWTWEDELIRRSGGADLDYWLRRYKDVHALPPDLKEEFHGHDYAFVLPIGLADAFLAVGDVEEAYNTYREVLKRAPILYGSNDRKSLFLMRAMAVCAAQRGRFQEAEGLARKAAEAAKAAYGQWHYQTAMCLDTLAIMLVPQTLGLGPGSEFWNITQEAYDAARVALWEGHPMAKRLKRRLEEFSSESEAAGAVDEELFQDIMIKVFADGPPKFRKGYMERVSVAYREARSERCRAQDKLSPAEKRRLARQRAADAELKSRGGDAATETQPFAPRTKTLEGPRRKKGWKGKEKATITLSPILEDRQHPHEGTAVAPYSIIDETSDNEPPLGVNGKGKALPQEVG
jgi:tetratricopeptide (TPR) repeat protein